MFDTWVSFKRPYVSFGPQHAEELGSQPASSNVFQQVLPPKKLTILVIDSYEIGNTPPIFIRNSTPSQLSIEKKFLLSVRSRISPLKLSPESLHVTDLRLLGQIISGHLILQF